MRHAALALLLALPGTPSLATGVPLDLAGGDAIRAAIAGNTVQGSMGPDGAYTEFYAADGTIKGRDYVGRWTIEGDAMCFAYGTDPATCYGVSMGASGVVWVAEGMPAGDGAILPGNPNGF